MCVKPEINRLSCLTAHTHHSKWCISYGCQICEYISCCIYSPMIVFGYLSLNSKENHIGI